MDEVEDSDIELKLNTFPQILKICKSSFCAHSKHYNLCFFVGGIFSSGPYIFVRLAWEGDVDAVEHTTVAASATEDAVAIDASAAAEDEAGALADKAYRGPLKTKN